MHGVCIGNTCKANAGCGCHLKIAPMVGYAVTFKAIWGSRQISEHNIFSMDVLLLVLYRVLPLCYWQHNPMHQLIPEGRPATYKAEWSHDDFHSCVQWITTTVSKSASLLQWNDAFWATYNCFSLDNHVWEQVKHRSSIKCPSADTISLCSTIFNAIHTALMGFNIWEFPL